MYDMYVQCVVVAQVAGTFTLSNLQRISYGIFVRDERFHLLLISFVTPDSADVGLPFIFRRHR